MALTINTNVSSLIAQRNLSSATKLLNTSIERMTTGYKINTAADNAAGHSIMTSMNTYLGSLDVATDNAAMATDMLTTLEDTYGLITSHLQRIRDLTEQASNGTYATASLEAIQSEIQARLDEIDRIAGNCEYNSKKLMNGTISADVLLQVGLYNDSSSQITLSKDLFANANVSTLFSSETDLAKKCAGLVTGTTAASMLTKVDKVLGNISKNMSSIGASQNRLESAIESLDVQYQNMTSSLSTIRDTDVAEESSNYIKAQILQQASATLLATSNQLPSIALNLI